jgi:acyltransferase
MSIGSAVAVSMPPPELPAEPVAILPVRERVVVLDLLRLCAAVQMVEGHTLDAVLASASRHGELYGLWNASRGLTSVAFLLVAGMSFHLVRLRGARGEHGATRPVAPRSGLARGLRRGAGLIALGYVLHLPVGHLLGVSGTPDGAWLPSALAVDILQCMGVGLLLLELGRCALRSPRALEVACAAGGMVVLALSAGLSAWSPGGPWLPLLQYLSPRGGSLFPLFPWLAHLLFGVALGGWLLAPGRRAPRFWLAAGTALIFGRLLALEGASLAADHLTRLGWVLLAGAALQHATRAVRGWPTWVFALSRQTLFVYVFHVLLVYGDHVGLGSLIGPVLSPVRSLGVALAVLVLSFAVALGHARWRDRVRTRPCPDDSDGLIAGPWPNPSARDCPPT